MFVVLGDTHGTDGPRLTGRTREAVGTADAVVHAGDHTTPAALDGLHEAAGGPVHAVHGNADTDEVRERLPTTRVCDLGGVAVVVTHTREGGRTALAMLGRSRDAPLVVFGHTHRPTVVEGTPTLLNPGSHASPRGAPATHAELERRDDGLDGRIVTTDGDTVERFAVRGRNG